MYSPVHASTTQLPWIRPLASDSSPSSAWVKVASWSMSIAASLKPVTMKLRIVAAVPSRRSIPMSLSSPWSVSGSPIRVRL